MQSNIIEYQASEFRRRSNGSRVHAPFPDGYETDISYDGSVKALAYLLANECNVSINKIQSLLKEVTGGELKISAGTINGLLKEFSQKSRPERKELIKNILESPVINIDFTNANVNGKTRQVLIAASPIHDTYMYFGRDSKGHKGIIGTPLEHYVGTLIHDHDKTFYSYGLKHQEYLCDGLGVTNSYRRKDEENLYTKVSEILSRKNVILPKARLKAKPISST